MWPDVKIVGNSKTFQMIKQFYQMDLEGRTLEVKEGDELPLGRHTLRFYMAPMVHWPEVMFTYETSKHILFSADAFGSFGGYNGNLFCDDMDYFDQHMEEARRYYTNIVGKYGQQVLGALCLNKTFSLPPRFCLMQTANHPGEAMQAEGIEQRMDAFALQMLRTLKNEEQERT